MLIPGGQIGERASKGRITEKQYQAVNTDKLDYCWRHPITLTSDWKNPSPEDKKQLEEIRLKETEVKNKDGSITKSRFCPKCFVSVPYTKL